MLSLPKPPAPLVVALLGAVPAVPGAFVLAGIVSGPTVDGLLAGIVNPRYFSNPAWISLHIASGILFCLLAPLQFSARLRVRRWHRYAGRVALLSGMVFGLSALPALGLVPKGADWARLGGLATAAVAFSGALALSYAAIRRRDIRAHRAWALRAVAIGLMGASRVLIEALAYLALGEVTDTMGGVVIWLAIGLNLLIVEFHLRQGTQPQTQRK